MLADVKAFGALGDGIQDDFLYIKRAVKAVERNGGGEVFFPPGTYLISNTIKVKSAITLRGTGWGKSWKSAETAVGSWIRLEYSKVTAVKLSNADGASIVDLGFCCAQLDVVDDSWQPYNYPFTIVVSGSDDAFISRVMLFNPKRGMHLSHSGRVTIDGLFGNPLRTGLLVEQCHDSVVVRHIEFNRYWERLFLEEEDEFTWVTNYRLKRGVGLEVTGASNPMFSELNFLGFHFGVLFSGTTKAENTDKFRLTAVDCDSCAIGISIESPNTTGMVTQYTSQGATGEGEYGIDIGGAGVRFQGSNLRITSCNYSGIRVTSEVAMVLLNNVWIDNWNLSHAGHPGIEVVSSSQVLLGPPLLFQNGNGAIPWSAGVVDDTSSGHPYQVSLHVHN